jgi:WD40 repeat protein
MRGRDLAVLGIVLAVGGAALGDALRNRGDTGGTAPSEVPTVPGTSRRTTTTPRPQPTAPEDFPLGALQGSLIFSTAGDCTLHSFDLAGGSERPPPRVTAAECEFRAALRGRGLAYRTSAQTFGVIESRSPPPLVGNYEGLFDSIVWSPDGRRLAWCDNRKRGFQIDLEARVLPPSPRRLSQCPIGYTSKGKLVFAALRRLVVGKRTILRTPTPGAITKAWWGADGSVAVLVEPQERVERWERGRLTASLQLGPSSEAADLSPSPGNCALAFADRRSGVTQILGLGCFRGASPEAFFGHAASWSPDGEWLAVAEPKRIAFLKVVGEGDVIYWPARVEELAWTTG